MRGPLSAMPGPKPVGANARRRSGRSSRGAGGRARGRRGAKAGAWGERRQGRRRGDGHRGRGPWWEADRGRVREPVGLPNGRGGGGVGERAGLLPVEPELVAVGGPPERPGLPCLGTSPIRDRCAFRARRCDAYARKRAAVARATGLPSAPDRSPPSAPPPDASALPRGRHRPLCDPR